MLKKVIEFSFIIALFFFSSFYTDRVLMAVKSKDPIMIKINDYKNTFNYKSLNAMVQDNTVVPGLDGCKVNITASYNTMKRINEYNLSSMQYAEVKPKVSIDNIYDKYIVKGKKEDNEVAIIFKMKDNNYLNDILDKLKKLDIKASFFMDGKYIEDNSKKINKVVKSGYEIYNLGYDGDYDRDLLVWTNNLIDTVTHNKSTYCLVTKKNDNILNLCGKYKMHTIKSNILINNSTNISITNKLIEKGSIIVFEENSSTVNYLNDIVMYLNKKGYTYNLLSTHLSEKRCNK